MLPDWAIGEGYILRGGECRVWDSLYRDGVLIGKFSVNTTVNRIIETIRKLEYNKIAQGGRSELTFQINAEGVIKWVSGNRKANAKSSL